MDPLPLLCGRHIWNPPRSAFLTRYHESGVRELVLEQLQGMADGGATIISTRLWLVDMAGTTSEAYRSEQLLLGTEILDLSTDHYRYQDIAQKINQILNQKMSYRDSLRGGP